MLGDQVGLDLALGGVTGHAGHHVARAVQVHQHPVLAQLLLDQDHLLRALCIGCAQQDCASQPAFTSHLDLWGGQRTSRGCCEDVQQASRTQRTLTMK